VRPGPAEPPTVCNVCPPKRSSGAYPAHRSWCARNLVGPDREQVSLAEKLALLFRPRESEGGRRTERPARQVGQVPGAADGAVGPAWVPHGRHRRVPGDDRPRPELPPGVRLFHADIGQWELPRSYDLIVAWDSVWHVPLSQQEAVLTKLCRGLAALVFTTGGTDALDERHNSYVGPPMYHATLGIPRTLHALAEAGSS
jgi:hypothetical protein